MNTICAEVIIKGIDHYGMTFADSMLIQLLNQPLFLTSRIITFILCLLLLPINNASATFYSGSMSDHCPTVMTKMDCCPDTAASLVIQTNLIFCQDNIEHANCLQHCQSSCHTTLILPGALPVTSVMISTQSDHPYLSGYWDEPVSTLLRPPIHL